MIRTCIIGITIACAAFFVNAVEISLSGTVTKTEGGAPIESVMVMTSLFRGFDEIQDLTDNEGKFSIHVQNASTLESKLSGAATPQFFIKDNSVSFSPSLGSVSGRVDVFSADGQQYASIPFSGLEAGKKSIGLPAFSTGLIVIRCSINGSRFTRKLLCMANTVYSHNGFNYGQKTVNGGLAKRAAVIDTLIAKKQDLIDGRILLDSYNMQNIAVSMSNGVLRSRFTFPDQNLISGWKFDSIPGKCLSLWSVSTLYLDIDGGYDEYTKRGMLQAFDMRYISGPINSEGNPYTFEKHNFIMDFGTEANAKTMYDFRKAFSIDRRDTATIPGYSMSNALANTSPLGGITVYAYYKQFYFEFSLLQFPNAPTDALPVAKQFLDYFIAKAQ